MSGFHGKFVWYELMTTDLAAAEAFYAAVIGWRAQDSGMPGIKYTLFKAAADPAVAGAMTLPADALANGARPGWIGYVAVDDVDGEAARVTEAGGMICHPPTDIPGVGRFALIADPQGALLSLFKGQGELPPGPALPDTPGQAGWRELRASDGEAAFAFYAGLFGWTKVDAIDMGPMGTYQLFGAGGETLGGMMTKLPDLPRPSWLYYFNVDGIDAAAERVTKAGGQVTGGPHQVPGGTWIVQCLDPQGAAVALSSARR